MGQAKFNRSKMSLDDALRLQEAFAEEHELSDEIVELIGCFTNVAAESKEGWTFKTTAGELKRGEVSNLVQGVSD